jgi:D-threo-aldose 1-dehydrogenase
LSLEYDYSYDGVMRQVEHSMQRMGTDRFDVLMVHDPDRWTHGSEQPARFQEALDGAFPALLALRDQGVVSAIGIGVNEVDVCMDAARAVDIDCILIAGAYTLLNQQAADELFPLCVARGVAVMNARVFGSGVLATGSGPSARFNYAPADDAVLGRVRDLEALCDRHGVALGAAAVQFAVDHPAVVNVCVGTSSVPQQEQSYRWLEEEIPAEFWDELIATGLVGADGRPSPVH